MPPKDKGKPMGNTTTTTKQETMYILTTIRKKRRTLLSCVLQTDTIETTHSSNLGADIIEEKVVIYGYGKKLLCYIVK